MRAKARKGKVGRRIWEEEGKVSVLGPSGAGECGVAHRRVNSVHEGWERRKLGGGLERKREDLFPGEKANRAGSFIRLGVTDLEKRRFGICIPKGKGEREDGFYGGVLTEGLRAQGYYKGQSGDKGGGNKEQCEQIEAMPDRLGKGCALFGIRDGGRSKRVLASGVRSVGGTQLGLEMWSPRFGCSAEGEDRKEAWRVLRHRSSNGRRTWEWARIQVKLNGGVLPSLMEIRVEGEVYAMSLWWEIPPTIRKKQGDGRDGFGRQRGEVRGGDDSRAGWRVGEKPGAGPQGTASVRGRDGRASGRGGWGRV
ncbi:hypothetical protein CK203_025608 [Vitis vinifera]|uniref:DUF4283 domain-containing protein n=1 Tax=Vitis vinifera TaxID=29760 RepID=A0A438IEM0_VITVI|nr:hypothetical protein CK203_025608 [Vitis vinifera]